MAHLERVVVLVDMDCFYCQVEEKLDPRLCGEPIAVVQYNAWKGGGIIAVNYPARDRGVTRHMRGDEAKEKCPEITLVKVPNVRGKADLTKYREAGKRVAEVLQTFTPMLERASVDEAYLDITEEVNKRIAESKSDISLDQLKNTHVVGCETVDFLCGIYNGGMLEEHNLKLAIGGVITEKIRAAVYEQTGYRCSAGIAHNKILAKLGAGMHKPNKQTILPLDRIESLYETLPLRKIRSLGGKFGEKLAEDLNIKFMGELRKFSEAELARKYDPKTVTFLYNIARGIDLEPVSIKLISKSIGCCKKFAGRAALCDVDSVTHWVKELSEEIAERLEQDAEENNRRAKQIIVSFTQDVGKTEVSSSRTVPLYVYESDKIQKTAMSVINKFCLRPDNTYKIKFLGLSVGKFEDTKRTSDISSFFKNTLSNSAQKPKENIEATSSKNNSAQKEKENIDSKAKTAGIIKGNKPKGIMALFNNASCSKSKPLNVSADKGNNKNISIINDSTLTNTCINDTILNNNSEFTEIENNFVFNEIENNFQFTEMENNFEFTEIEKNSVDLIFDSVICDVNNDCDDCDSNDSQKTVILPPEHYEKFEVKKYEDYFNVKTGEKLQESEINLQLIEEDSTSNEVENIVANSCNLSGKTVQQSFFLNYFKNMEETKSASRDFNTSKSLLELEDDTDNIDTETDDKNNHDQVIEINYDQNTENNYDNEDQQKEISIEDNCENLESLVSQLEENIENTENSLNEKCLECNKIINFEDIQSHKDYHFAISIVREESMTYNKKPEYNIKQKTPMKNESNNKQKIQMKNEKTQSKKRKSSNDANNKNKSIKLTSFFTKSEQNSHIPSEVCSECGKHIPIDELEVHKDFHAAKKLHLEINNISSNNIASTSKMNLTNLNDASKVAKKSSKSAVKPGSVLSYFKPL